MQTIAKISKSFISALENIYPKEEIKTFVEILFEHYSGYSKTDLILKSEENLGPDLINKINNALLRLKNTEPIQYIIGETEFFGIRIKVTPAVLIPRPETEELLAWIIENHAKSQIRLLDIGTGSGCIPLAVKYNIPDAKIYAVDISSDAIEVARENAKFNNLKVNFMQFDILQSGINQNVTDLDVIVSNPPYVLNKERNLMHKNVLENEPHLALFVDDNDALVFYKAIIRFAHHHLKKSGALYFEINEAYGDEMIKLLQENNYKDIELRNDINGKARMIMAIRQ